MKAWLIDQFNGVENARLREIASPVPAASEVLLKVDFAALNPADAYLALGQYPARPPLPHILGRDGVGQIVAVGEGVTDHSIGQTRSILRGDVGVARWGTFAEFVTVPVESLVEAPPAWTAEQAASATLVYLTAYQAIKQWEDLPQEMVILISGASGGVGVAATQLGVAMGHTIIGLSRNAEKRVNLKSLGMNLALDPTDLAWRKTLGSFLGKRKVNLVIDNVGGAVFSELLATLGDRGRVSVVGRLAGEVPNFNTASLFFRRLRIGGVAVGAYTNDESRAAWKEVLELLNRRGDRPLIDHVFSFDQLRSAFQRLAEGPMGKVLIKV